LSLREAAKVQRLNAAAFAASRAGLRRIPFGAIPDERD
jgi:hypothetical protein